MTPSLPDLNEATLHIDPLPRSETIPSAWYVDPAYHDFDLRHVFAGSWQYVGPAEQVRDPGSYLAATIAGEPIVVIRDQEDILRAWFNVCQHRGGPLVTDSCGMTRMLQCKYHGWTYKLDGTLRGVPRFDRTDLFDKRHFGLRPLEVAEWGGMVFASVGRDLKEKPRARTAAEPGDPPVSRSTRAQTPSLTLAGLVEGIGERIHPISLDRFEYDRRETYEVDCNWKVYVDNYLEGYHLPLVHPELCDVLDFRNYVTETYPNYSLQYSPFREGDNPYGSSDGEAFYYFFFPNIMLNILPTRLQVNSVVPIAHNRTKVVFDYFFDPGISESARKADVDFSDRVQLEDVEICEHVQRGLCSRAYDRGRFSTDAEPGVYHFQCMLKHAYRTALNGGGAGGAGG